MFSYENKPGNRKNEKEIFVFHPDEILSKEESKKRNKGRKAPFNNISFSSNSRYVSSVKGMWTEFKGRIVSGAVTIAVLGAVCIGANALDYKLGYEAILDGETIGLVTDEQTVYDAIEAVRADLVKYMGEDASYTREPVFVRRIVSGKNVSDSDSIKEHLMSHLDYMVESVSISISGETAVALTSEEAAEWVLAKHKEAFGGVITDDTAADFVEDVEVKKSFVHIGLLKTPEEALTILAGEDNSEEREYIVKDNDTLWDIANAYDLSVERLLALNSGVSENIKAGDVLKVEETVPVLSVRTVSTEEYTEEVPFPVEQIKDAEMYENTTAVTQQGVNGENKVIAKITKVNGVETDRQALSSEKITEPVKQIEKIGTKKRPPTTGSGTFLRPTVGSLSSRYGSRWGRNHNGIDIAGSHNSPIKAADGGVVTYSGWMDGYGNYIVINHENGYQTAYGHCASLCKNVGDRVAKGDVIAKMGNTGRSTGTHLHFEVKKNGAFQDPLKFVTY